MKEENKGFVVVAGQMPPPVGGQNLVIEQIYHLVRDRLSPETCHWRFNFTRDSAGFGVPGFEKILEVFRVLARLCKLRSRGRIRAILYPVGGPHLVAVVRDLILLLPARLCADRVYLHFHAAGAHEFMESRSNLFSRIIRFFYSQADSAVVMTEFGKRDATALGLKDCFVMPNGFEDQAGEWKREAVGEGSPVKILSVGHLCREKGTPELIRAFGALQAEFPESELHLVGEPARDLNQEELDALCAETGVPERIIHRGLLRGEALQAAYQEADLFVFSTVAPYESFGMVLIEAMHWSLPIVATDWRANTEVCGPQLGGVVAREVEKDLAGSLERALRQALEQRSQWAEWGQANRRRYEEQFTTKKLEENLSTLLQ